MSHKSYCGTPVSSKPGLNNSKSLFHDFVRPRGQFSAKLGSSPFKGSPHPENFDFIPLSFSSPVNSTSKRGGGGNWKGGNRKSFVGSPGNSSWNSSFSPYNMNRKHFHSSSASSNGNSGFSPCNNMDTSRKCSSIRRRMDSNVLGNAKNADDISLYYHPSMLEDPWAELEQKLKNSTADQNYSLSSKDALEKCGSNLTSVDTLTTVSDSDEGADTQETDSSVSVSDGSS